MGTAIEIVLHSSERRLRFLAVVFLSPLQDSVSRSLVLGVQSGLHPTVKGLRVCASVAPPEGIMDPRRLGITSLLLLAVSARP